MSPQTCSVCNLVKSFDDFYRGVKSRCKECHKAAVKKNRAENVEYYRAFDRARAWLPERVLLRKKREERVKNDPELRAINAARVKAWMGRHAIKRHAHNAVSNAIRDGKLAPQPCERCGDAIGVQAHHEDYTKPLDVNWLCPPCHGLRHREINEERRKRKAA